MSPGEHVNESPGGDRFNLVLTGNTLSGRDREDVAAALAKLMRITKTQALELLSGCERVIKRELDEEAMQRYHRAFYRTGAQTRTEVVGNHDPRLQRLRGEAEALYGPRYLDRIPLLLQCPCCQGHTLAARLDGERCAVCGWEDGSGQHEFLPAAVISGRNRGLSLSQARVAFREREALRNYRPDHVPLRKRLGHGVAAFLLFAYAGYGLWQGQMMLPLFSPGSRTGSTIPLEGGEVWVIAGAMIFAAGTQVLMIVDHYDRRPNERLYAKWGLLLLLLPFDILFVLGLILYDLRTEGTHVAAVQAFLLIQLGGVMFAAAWFGAYKRQKSVKLVLALWTAAAVLITTYVGIADF